MHLPFRAVTLLAISFSLPILLIATDPATPAATPPPPASVINTATPSPAKTDPAADKFWQALKLLKSTKPADLAAGRTALQAASDREFTHAQVLLGNCLLAGSYGITKDPRKSANLFRLAAAHGNAFAKVSLGQCLFTGTGVRKDVAQATEWLSAALAPGADYSRPVPPPDFFASDPATNPNGETSSLAGAQESDPIAESQATAHFLLGQISDQQKKSTEAQTHFVAAANAGAGGRDGIYQAALQAALNYAFGNGTPRDLPKAHEMLSQSRKLAGRMSVSLIHNYTSLKLVDEFAVADLEDSVAKAGATYESELQLKIAATFADKKSKDYNPAEAVKWYELAAENDQVWAMLSLAFLYAGNELGRPDFAQAFHWFEKAGGGEKPKHLLGAANLGICLHNGIGTPPDAPRAAELFKKFKDIDILCYLGSIGQAPKKITSFDEAAQLNRTWAADKADPHAQYLLAIRYLNGFGVKPDLKEAVRWLKKATKAKHAAALCQLGFLYEKYGTDLGLANWHEARKAAAECYRLSAETGYLEGVTNIAGMLQFGWGIAKDENKAEETYLRSLQIDPHHARTHCNLAGIYHDRLAAALEQNDLSAATQWRTKMLAHYEESVAQKYALAARYLGFIYHEGRLVPQDFRRAYGYFDQAAEWGLTDVHGIMGEMHELGQGVPITLTEAAYYYRLAALEGNLKALGRLVDFYVEGKGVSQDFERAMYWISFLAQKSGMSTITQLGDRFMREEKYEIADRLFEILSAAKDPYLRGLAHQRLSVLYTNGWGVAQDLAQAKKHRKLAVDDDNLPALHDSAVALFAEGKKEDAVDLFKEAAKRGSSESQYKLGMIYLNGDGVSKNLKKAVKLLEEAADRGNPPAEVAFAGLVLDKIPGAPDLEQAIKLAESAASAGQPQAKELAEKLKHLRKP